LRRKQLLVFEAAIRVKSMYMINIVIKNERKI